MSAKAGACGGTACRPTWTAPQVDQSLLLRPLSSLPIVEPCRSSLILPSDGCCGCNGAFVPFRRSMQVPLPAPVNLSV